MSGLPGAHYRKVIYEDTKYRIVMKLIKYAASPWYELYIRKGFGSFRWWSFECYSLEQSSLFKHIKSRMEYDAKGGEAMMRKFLEKLS